ncbi:MAG: endonuclease III [Candidatus Caenarcaniphilales bacterium]|nr:endonuclease III [Candidatus Caenarcaniphilales bacterium]
MPRTVSKEKPEEELKKRTKSIVKILNKKYGDVECFLFHNNAFELLCAVMLSAQCTDDRVNMVTPDLFEKYPTPKKLSLAKLSDVEEVIKSCGFYKNKAKNLIAMAQRLMSHHNGEIPETIEELTALAGVGRKTANVVLGNWFGKSAGVVVDTHVKRITNLLGITKTKEPEKIELELNKIVPKKNWDKFSLWLISHGRETCIARRPQCADCELNKYCDTYKSNT